MSCFDIGLRDALQSIIHSISDLSWRQATLPIRYGGLGLREASRSVASAFLGSCNSARPLIAVLLNKQHFSGHTLSEDQPVNIVREDAAKLQWTCLLNNSDCAFTKATQHSLQDLLDLATLAEIKVQSSLQDPARLNTLSSTHSGSWLWAVPNPKLGLTMLREEFLIACRVWLGLPVFFGPPNHLRCSCGQTLDDILCCQKGHLLLKHHDALRDFIYHCVLTDNKEARIEE